jgi:hypothetical protein
MVSVGLGVIVFVGQGVLFPQKTIMGSNTWFCVSATVISAFSALAGMKNKVYPASNKKKNKKVSMMRTAIIFSLIGRILNFIAFSF